MGSFRQKQKRFNGFTVVELLSAIVIIGILASITLVVYSGYQVRVRDSERKSDVGQVAAALGAYVLQKNNYIETGSGCGLNGNGNGWLNAGPAELGASYPKSIATCLQEAKVISNSIDFIDPSKCLWDSGGTCGSWMGQPARAYMKATCKKNNIAVTYVLAALESEPRKDNEVNALCDNNTLSGFDTNGQKWGTNYGMNYYVPAK